VEVSIDFSAIRKGTDSTPRDGIREVLRELIDKGVVVIVIASSVADARKWLDEHEVPYTSVVSAYDGAFFHIDDTGNDVLASIRTKVKKEKKKLPLLLVAALLLALLGAGRFIRKRKKIEERAEEEEYDWRHRTQSGFARQLAQVSSKARQTVRQSIKPPPKPVFGQAPIKAEQVLPESFWVNLSTAKRRIVEERLRVATLRAAISQGAPRDLAEVHARQYSYGRANQIVRKHIASLRASLKGTVPENVSKQVMLSLGPTWDVRLAQTETTEAISQGARFAAALRKGKEGADYQVLWVLDPGCNHCVFCPTVAGTTRTFWGVFIAGPPAHPYCCCYLVILANVKDPRIRTRVPSLEVVRATANESGVVLL